MPSTCSKAKVPGFATLDACAAREERDERSYKYSFSTVCWKVTKVTSDTERYVFCWSDAGGCVWIQTTC